MASRINHLIKENLITPPIWMRDQVFYEVMMGSVAHGCNEENVSDKDIYAVCIPPKEVIFPHLAGYIHGFSRDPNRFDNYQQHHIKDQEVEYDIDVYNIVRYFYLCMNCNPNMIDSLFVPQRCVLWNTNIGQMIRDNRQMFLSKKLFHKFRGYAYAQLHAISTKVPEPNSKRRANYDKFGYDTKYAYHVVRLCLECEQALASGDIIMDRDREVYKSIRRGDWSIGKIHGFFEEHERSLQNLYNTSKAIPDRPDEDKIRDLLLKCLSMHYKNLPITKKVSNQSVMDKIMELYELVKSQNDVELDLGKSE